MFKSRIDENLKADEISTYEDEELCYEIVKEDKEKLLTLEEARKLVEQNFLLNKEAFKQRFEEMHGNNCDPMNNQPLAAIEPSRSNYDEEYGEELDEFDDHSSEDGSQKYFGRGYEMYEPGIECYDVEDDILLEDTDLVSRTINIARRIPTDRFLRMTNYGKGPPPFWSNVFDDNTSGED